MKVNIGDLDIIKPGYFFKTKVLGVIHIDMDPIQSNWRIYFLQSHGKEYVITTTENSFTGEFVLMDFQEVKSFSDKLRSIKGINKNLVSKFECYKTTDQHCTFYDEVRNIVSETSQDCIVGNDFIFLTERILVRYSRLVPIYSDIFYYKNTFEKAETEEFFKMINCKKEEIF